jgi:serine-type D-Ala-D-Ala carboxypeptidase/endopeptidase
MNIGKFVTFICLALILSLVPAAAEDFTNGIHAYLQHRVELERKDVGIVVGLVDEHGSRIVSCGKMKIGSDKEVNGDTLFDIGSIGKTFTALLLQDMVERGEMKLDDPVASYLPESVKVPTYKGKQITLLHLATHTSGLPNMPDDMHPKRADNAYVEYGIQNLYAFVSGYRLTCAPGTKYQYSGVGMALLGQARRHDHPLPAVRPFYETGSSANPEGFETPVGSRRVQSDPGSSQEPLGRTPLRGDRRVPDHGRRGRYLGF